MLRMDEPARARLTAKASGDRAIVRDPGRACFWMTRKDGRWTLAGSALAGAPPPGGVPYGLAFAGAEGCPPAP